LTEFKLVLDTPMQTLVVQRTSITDEGSSAMKPSKACYIIR